MPHRDSYEPGTPSWVDLISPDVDASKAFYTGLFGWEAEDQLDDEGTRTYVMFRIEGRDVAGAGGQAPGMEGAPAMWNSYVATDDADATAKKAEAAGGRILMEPMDVMDAGRMAMIADPAGAMISIWQAGTHRGAGTVNEHNTLSWNELVTRQKDDVRDFYATTFGWELVDQDMGPSGVYTEAKIGGNSVAGLMDAPPGLPDDVPDHWGIYFRVPDVDAALDKVRELGGQVVMEPMVVDGVGRFATVMDPLGAAFSVMQFPEDL